MSVGRLVAASIEIWRERLRRLTEAPAQANDEIWWQTLDESVVGRIAHEVSAAFGRGFAESRCARALRLVSTLMPSARLQFAGTMAIAAAVAHASLMWPSANSGWWWLILPALVLAFGVLAVSISMRPAER